MKTSKNLPVETLAIALMALLFVTTLVYASATSRRLANNVESAIGSYYPDMELTVTAAENGEITIKGSVQTYYDKLRIFEIAYNLFEKGKIEKEFSRVPGVKKVISNLKVEPEVY